jgi:Rod binding domain-containing protein
MSTIPAQFSRVSPGQTAAASLSALTLGNKPAAQLNAPGAMPTFDVKAQARTKAIEFEASFLNSMFGQMFTGIDGEGPFGGTGGAGVWRSFLSDEYAKSFAKAGGIGLADHVYRSLLEHQAANSPVSNPQ